MSTIKEKIESTTPEPVANGKSNVLADAKSELVDKLGSQIDKMMAQGELHLPADYSAPNALRSAWLTLQETVDKDKVNVLTACSKPSIYNALLNMVIQGLNPAKKQLYFIAYGQQLVCQRSYFGDMALAQRVRPGLEFGYQLIFEGDEVEFEIVLGKRHIKAHKQSFASQSGGTIVGAYCIAHLDGAIVGTVIMTIAEIRKSWSMSKTFKPDNKYGTHVDFEGDMCLRTVIRKCCKPIINSSSDELLMASLQETERLEAEAEIAAEVSENANSEIIEIPALEVQRSPDEGAKGSSSPIQTPLKEEPPF